jgi:hypothetical protein
MSHTAETEGASQLPQSRPPPQSRWMADVVGASLALAAESALIAAVGAGWLPLFVALAGHFVVVAVLLFRYVRRGRAGCNGAASLLLAFVVLVAGPLGAFGGLIIGWLSRPERGSVERLSAWYDRISFSTELSATTRRSDRILTGRVANLDAAMPQSFLGVLQSGSVRDKQTILGLIARRFHPDYLPVLNMALVSEEPVIRVQAAAVAAKIRMRLAERTEAALAAAADPTQPLDAVLMHVTDAEKYAACGLMEEPDKVRAIALINGVLASTAHRIETEPALRRASGSAALLQHHEARLLAGKRYGEFRFARRSRYWIGKGLRFRSLAREEARRRAARTVTGQPGAVE